jgi:prevent-host-death family protein
MEVTATQIKQNSAILNEALREDIVVTRRRKPYVVIVDYDKYMKLEKLAWECEAARKAESLQNRWLQSAKEGESGADGEERAFYDALEVEAMQVMERPDD